MPKVDFDTLDQWLNWIESCHPSEIELGLDRLRQVYEALALDLSSSRKVIIGGTNGKGSTVAMLDRALRDQGYSVGCFTSPHFIRYNERVKLAGKPVEDPLLIEAFRAIEVARGDISLTYFEYNTLAALYIFARQKPDVALLEVGLGGRLDAVNIIDADLAVVTTVSVDHVDWLGDDREQIGFEKAGIYRAGAVAICGDPNPPQKLIDHATAIGADLYLRMRDFDLQTDADGAWNWRGVSAAGSAVELPGLPDIHLPKANGATVLQVLQLIGLAIDSGKLARSLADATLTGRMQAVEYAGFPFTLDVAHNPEAAEYLAGRLRNNPAAGRTLMLLGMLADKDIDQVLTHLVPVVDRWALTTLSVPRGQTSEQLQQKLAEQGVAVDSCTAYGTVQEALTGLQEILQEGDRVIVAGSFFTVAGALTAMNMDG